VAGECQRQPVRCPADTRAKLRPSFAKGNEFDGKASIHQQSRQMFRTVALGARRIDGVGANELLCQFD